VARNTASPRGKRARSTTVRRDSTANGSAGADGSAPKLGTRHEFTCPVCGDGNADATYKIGREGEPRWFVGCKSLKCERGAAYLDDLGVALGVGAGRMPDELALVIARMTPARRSRRDPEPLPTDEQLAGWVEQLRNSPEPRAWLDCRGVSLNEATSQYIGWDGRRLTLPMSEATGIEFVGFKTRSLEPGARTKSIAGKGRPWPLYPPVDSGPARARSWTLLCAGEFDALAARSVGLPASSVTLGAGTWRDEWTEQLHGLRVVVCFDNNEVEQARAVVCRLRSAGVRAQRLDLRRLGLDTPSGDLNDYLTSGGDPSAVHPRRVVHRSKARSAA